MPAIAKMIAGRIILMHQKSPEKNPGLPVRNHLRFIVGRVSYATKIVADTQYKGDNGMKNGTKWLPILLVAVFMVAGCGKKSGLEGKVVDGKGQPISGLKVIAKQVQPIKGYEQFEAKTGSDGTFSFSGLYPSSDYIIAVWHKDWSTDAKANVTAGPEGETILLKAPIQILLAVNAQGMPMDPQTDKPRFAVSGDPAVIFDSFTGLEWMVGPDRTTTWEEAKAWCGGLSVAGGGWRMPQIAELKTLYFKGLGERNMVPMFSTTGRLVYSGEFEKSASALNFDSGGENWLFHQRSEFRMFAVRSRK